ncbi:MAG: TonB-dependent receptor [Gammaproteobacteria bacterium]|nr:TonB-dependent receptor [Gammaproteobacteria bacterium]
MKFRTITSLLAVAAVALSSMPVAAQDTSDETLEEIVVVGIRGSIRRAEAIKRDAKNIVEAITTEDLGKFSDDSLAESLQRLPGVQVEQDLVGSAGDKVSVRGLGPQFVVATVNGRTVWSSGTGEGRELRSFNFSVIPSEIISEVQVYKTPVAETVESGIGGSIDVLTLRPLSAPFDGRNWFGQIDVRTEMVDAATDSQWFSGAGDWGPRLSGAIGGRNDAGTVGAFLAFNYSELDGARERQQIRWRTNRDIWIDTNNNYIAEDEERIEDPTTLRDILYGPESFTQERGGIAAALEFRPSDELSIVADLMFTQTDRINRRPNTRFDIERTLRDGTLFAPDSIILADGGLDDYPAHTTFVDINGARCIVDGVETQSPECNSDIGRPGRPRNSRAVTLRDQFRNNFRDTWVGGINLKYDRGAWHVNADVFANDLDAIVLETSIDAETTDIDGYLIGDLRGDGQVTANVDQADLVAENFDARRLRIRQRSNQGDQVGARVDFEVEMDNDAIDSIQFGARYNDQEFSYLKSQRPYWGQQIRGDEDFSAAMRTDGFHFPVNGVSLPAFDIFAARDFLSDLDIPAEFDSGFGPCVAGNVADSLNLTGRFDPDLTRTCLDLRDSFTVTEKTVSAYAALNFVGDLGNVPVSGNFGLRYVTTENTSTGAITIEFDGDDEIDPDPDDLVTTTGDFSKLLPSLNLRFDMSESVQIRFAVAESLSRPDLYDLTPRFKLSIDDEDESGDFTPEDCNGGNCLIQRGNPDLDPYTAWNYDLTVMWDTPFDAFIAASLFYKDIEGFIFDSISGPVTVPGYGDAQFFVRQPTNASPAKVSGFEIAVHQPFTFLPAPFDGLGAQLNYSYTDSEFSGTDADADDLAYGLPGASPHNLNAILYYETERFGARLAYVYRDSFFSTPAGGPDGLSRFIAETESLSLSMDYDITERITVKAQARNLTEDLQREFTNWETLPINTYTRPRSYSIGVRVKF